MPEKKICYLLRLEKDLPTPAKLASDMDKAEVRTPAFKQNLTSKFPSNHSSHNYTSAFLHSYAPFCRELSARR